jgi:S-DNA-T family DNA segregation ATPase FtsK/SpoIIIE
MPGSTTTNRKKTTKATSTRKSSKKTSPKKKGTSLKAILTDDRFRQISGFLLIALGVYFAFTFSSYLYNHFISGPETRYWAGGLGYKIANQFIKIGFGVSSYFISYWLVIYGFKLLFKIQSKFFARSFKYTFAVLVWLSMSLGFIFQNNDQYSILAGFFGIEMNRTIQVFIGKVGMGLLLLFILLSMTTIAWNIPLKWMKTNPNRKPRPKKTKVKESPDTENDEFDIIDEGPDNGNSDQQTKDQDDIQPVKGNTQPEPTQEPTPEPIPEPTQEHAPEPIPEPAPELTNQTEFEFDDTQIEKKPKTKEGVAPDFEIEDTTTNKPEIKKKDGPLTKSEEDLTQFGIETEYDPRLDLGDFRFPGTDLLINYGDDTIKIRKDELEANKNRIVETLNNYSIKIDKIKATVGPTVTLYEIIPAPGVRISKIKNLEDDIALSLSAMGIRIIAPIPGKGTIGIEVPNSNKQIVSMKTLLKSEKFASAKYELPIALGKTISNEIFITDLTKMPHLLMAGATGQGKSVGLNCIIASLLYKKHPSELKFVMVDPKKVELSLFSKIERHYLAKLPDAEEAIITDTRNVVRTLNSLGLEMDSRYDLLKNAQVRNIKEYNAKFRKRKLNPENGHRFLPYIVLVVDEFADLIMTAGKEVESPIARLAQLARAVGIHLIIATQRPSVNIITGVIKANFPARVAFRVISKIDSRTILDTGGADQLIGRGDMLMSTGGDLVRLQCAFVDTPEVDAICDFIGEQRGYPDAFMLPEYLDEEAESSKDISADEYDDLFEDAARLVVSHQHGSTSLLQRKLKLGYNRAGRIIDQLEAAGIVGPFEGSKAREVRVANELALEQHLQDLKKRDF